MNINPRLWIGLLAAVVTYLVLTAFSWLGDGRSNRFHCERGDWHNQYEEARSPESFRND